MTISIADPLSAGSVLANAALALEHELEKLADAADLSHTESSSSASVPSILDRILAAPPYLLERTSGASEPSAEEQVTSAFEAEFGALAADKEAFDALMQQVFGDDYDKELAEEFRQQALAGDFSWLPDVQFVDAATLGGANGAYNAEDDVVYINRDLAASDPAAAAQTFVEEAGHSLDAKLNTSDSTGDEGELFRRLLGGEQLSDPQIAAIRADDDHGTIIVDGKEVQVEFWDPFKALGDAVDAVGDALSDAASAVGNAVSDAANAVWDGVQDVAAGVWNGIEDVASGIGGAIKEVGYGLLDMTWGFFSNLFQGNFGEAFSSVVRGLDRAIFQSTERFWVGIAYGAQDVMNGVTDALGPLGTPIRWVSDRVFDIGLTAFDTAIGIGRDAFRLIPDTFTGFVGDMERAVELAFQGRWGAALGQFGMAFVNVPKNLYGTAFDMGVRVLQATGSIGQTALGLEPPALRFDELTAAEQQYLKDIYGDSIDYGLVRIKEGGALNNIMAAHTVGNTIYLPATDSQGTPNFNPDGTLTTTGLQTVGHEMGHVWQNQNGGGDYLHDALLAQLGSIISIGDRNEAYDWRKALASGETFESMNAEEQAKVMEDIGVALQGDAMITAIDGKLYVASGKSYISAFDNQNYTAAEIAFLTTVANEVMLGQGAG